jgi:hypothetical protein
MVPDQSTQLTTEAARPPRFDSKEAWSSTLKLMANCWPLSSSSEESRPNGFITIGHPGMAASLAWDLAVLLAPPLVPLLYDDAEHDFEVGKDEEEDAEEDIARCPSSC